MFGFKRGMQYFFASQRAKVLPVKDVFSRLIAHDTG